MPAPKQYLSGSYGLFKNGDENFCVSSFTVAVTSNWEETPTNCTPGVKTRSFVDKDFTCDVTVRYDGITPPSINDGDVLEDLQLGNKKGSVETIEFSAAYSVVTSKKRNNPIPGTVTYDLTIQAQGDFQWGALPTVTP